MKLAAVWGTFAVLVLAAPGASARDSVESSACPDIETELCADPEAVEGYLGELREEAVARKRDMHFDDDPEDRLVSREAYREAKEEYQGEVARLTEHADEGLVGAGATLVTIGAASFIVGTTLGLLSLFGGAEDPHAGTFGTVATGLLVAGSAGLAAGVPMLSIGLTRVPRADAPVFTPTKEAVSGATLSWVF